MGGLEITLSPLGFELVLTIPGIGPPSDEATTTAHDQTQTTTSPDQPQTTAFPQQPVTSSQDQLTTKPVPEPTTSTAQGPKVTAEITVKGPDKVPATTITTAIPLPATDSAIHTTITTNIIISTLIIPTSTATSTVISGTGVTDLTASTGFESPTATLASSTMVSSSGGGGGVGHSTDAPTISNASTATSLPVGAIVGIVIGILLVVAALLGLATILMPRRRIRQGGLGASRVRDLRGGLSVSESDLYGSLMISKYLAKQ